MLSESLSYLRRRWYFSVSAVIVITLLMGLQLSGVSFNISFSQFFPDSESVKAKERIDAYFPSDSNVHYLLFEERNPDDDVLTPDSLRLAHHISTEIGKLEGVDEVQSVPLFYNNIMSYIGENGIMGSTNTEIENLTYLLSRLLSEDDPESLVSAILGTDAGTSSTLVSEVRLAADVFLSKDFSDNGKASSMITLVFLDQSLSADQRKDTVAEIEDVCDSIVSDPSDALPTSPSTESPFTIKHTGEDLALMQIDREINESKYILSVAALLFIGTVLYFSFRRISRVLLPMITLALALVWTFGATSFMGIEHSPLDLAVIPLVVGLGVDFSIHLLKRYDEEINLANVHDEDSRDRAFAVSSREVSRALVIAAATTIIAFLANIFSKVDPVFNFGITCSIGIAFSLFLSLFFLFPITAVLDHYMAAKYGKRYEFFLERGARTPYFIGRTMKNITRSVTRYPVLVLIVVILITTVGLISGVRVDREFSMDDFVSEDLEARQIERKVQADFTASSMSRGYFLYEGKGNLGPGAIRDMADKMLYIEEAPHMVRIDGEPRTNSIFTLMGLAMEMNGSLYDRFKFDQFNRPLDNCTEGDVLELIDYLQTNDTICSIVRNTTFSQELSRVYISHGDGKGYAAIITIYVNSRTWEESRELVSQLKKGQADTTDDNVETELTGLTVIVVETVEDMQSSQINGTITSLFLALIILFLLYHSIRYSLIAIFPVILSTIWVLGFMFLLSIPLNILTITVTSLTIGIGVDYSVHIIQRFREESKDHEPNEAMKRTLRSTGSSIFMSAISTVSGFLILLSSPLPVSRIFGLITALAVTFAFILSCALVPVVLLKSIRKST